jgi:hypothetical protein
MRKLRVVTNETFERYIDFLVKKEKFESRHRRIKFEDRFSDLDLDDITADVTAPTDGEIDSAVRDLDLFDDIAIKTGAKDVEVGGDGRLRLLDFDEPVKSKSSKSDKGDARTAGLDLDPKGAKEKDHPEDDRTRELDFDDKGAANSSDKSNVGAIGSLDYDDDVDTSNVAASIEDVYAALASDDPNTVKSIIKRYAPDIKDKNKIRDAMLVHATNLNLPCLRVLCGDMKIVLTAKEKKLGYVDRDDIKAALERLKNVARTLTGANNTYGLIPNAVVSCTPDNQIKCMNVIDFLKEWCELPIIPLYFRGAVIRHCYDLANYLLDEIGGTLPLDILTGSKGLLNRMKSLDDMPSSLMSKIAIAIAGLKAISSSQLGDLVIACINNGDTKSVKKIIGSVSAAKEDMIVDYVDEVDAAASQALAKIIKK